MDVEINGDTYYTMENFYKPDWWNKWLSKNLKKKLRLFSKKANNPFP
jgi:hypothetical protein